MPKVQLRRIRSKLKLAAQADPEYKVLGAGAHREP